MKERLVALTVLLVGVALAVASPPDVAIVAIALPLLGVVIGPRFRVDRVGQVAVTIAAMVVGLLVPRLLLGPEISSDNPTLLGERSLLLAMPVFAVAAARTIIASPVFGARLTLLAALVALTAAGRALSGLVYPAIAGLALAAGLAALYAADPVRPKLRLLGPRHVVSIVFGAAVAAALCFAAAWSMPKIHDAALNRLMARWGRDRTGFSGQLSLGDMAGLLQSNTVVMRVRGAGSPLLRGAVFSTYSTGSTYTAAQWVRDTALSGIEVVETPVAPKDRSSAIEIENAGKPVRYFLPLGARDVVVATGVYERDLLGIYSPSKKFEAKRVWFVEGGGAPPTPPAPADSYVPKPLRRPLRKLIQAWDITQDDPRARVAAIEARLAADYRYSLTFERPPKVDPVLDFLVRERQGHCEYFASAMALLARAADVPSRVVVGYRVAETSPLGYRVVRERHSHSWVEVWFSDHWVTVDPTPAADLLAGSPETTSFAGALADGIATTWEWAEDWLAKRSAFEMSASLVGLVALLLAARVLRTRVKRTGVAVVGDPPLAGFVALTRALASRGVARAPSETLSRFAARIEGEVGLGEGMRVEAAGLVRRYEALRYAGRGEAARLDREMAGVGKG